MGPLPYTPKDHSEAHTNSTPTDLRTVPGNAEAGPETHPDNPLRFATKDEAIAYGYNLLMSHFLVRATRIVETRTPSTTLTLTAPAQLMSARCDPAPCE